MDIAKSIRIAKAMNDMNNRDLSEVTGIDCGTLSLYARGKATPNTKTLAVISDGLNMPVSELISLGE